LLGFYSGVQRRIAYKKLEELAWVANTLLCLKADTGAYCGPTSGDAAYKYWIWGFSMSIYRMIKAISILSSLEFHVVSVDRCCHDDRHGATGY
jgi:hypothetical protein